MKTVSPELAKALKEKGFPQKTEFYWIKNPIDQKVECIYYQDKEQLEKDFVANRYDLISAPTADEILNSLPIYFDCNSDSHRYHMRIHPNFNGEKNGKEIKYWIIGYKLMEIYGGKWHEKNPFGDENLADAAAKLWLYLKENDLLESTEEQ